MIAATVAGLAVAGIMSQRRLANPNVLTSSLGPWSITETEDPLRFADCDADKCCRVEIYHEGAWGTICGDTELQDGPNVAAVACKQRGCDGTNASMKRFFGGGTGKVWLSKLVCPTGDEQQLSDCDLGKGWGRVSHFCRHSMDMGICCAHGCGVNT